jgi:hypothetical protein
MNFIGETKMVSNLLWTQLGLGNATPAALAGPPETPFEKQSDQLSVAPPTPSEKYPCAAVAPFNGCSSAAIIRVSLNFCSRPASAP